MPESSLILEDQRIDLVIFDHDGVLVDSELIANEVLAETLSAAGYPIDAERSMLSFMGKTFTAICTEVESMLGRSLPPTFARVHDERLFERLDRDLNPVDDVHHVLAVVQELGVRTCIASGSSLVRVNRSLRATGLLKHFEGHIYSAEQVQRGKPAPDLFLHASREEGVEPKRALVIEDSPSGVAAARAAGMTAFGYAGRTPVTSLAGADLTRTTMVDIADAVRARVERGRPGAAV